MSTANKIRLAAISAALLTSVIAAIPSKTMIVTPADLEQTFKSPIQEIMKVAKAKGINPDHLLAISAQESSLGKFKSGDNGCSKGWFHINTCPNANPAAAAIIGDPEREAEWVADKLISYGYLEGKITLAFARYNSPANPNYVYAEQVEKRLAELDIYLEPYRTPPEAQGTP